LTYAKNLNPTGIRSPDLPARSQSLYRLSYPGPWLKIYRAIILPVVLCGSETWSLILSDEHRFSLFETKVLSKTFEPKRDEVTGEWGKMHNKELRDFYSTPDFIGRID
jgi:hypothetical protein